MFLRAPEGTVAKPNGHRWRVPHTSLEGPPIAVRVLGSTQEGGEVCYIPSECERGESRASLRPAMYAHRVGRAETTG